MVIVTLDAGMALSEVTLQRSDDLVRWAVAEDGESVTSDGLTRRWRVGPPSGATHYYRAVVRAEAEAEAE